MNNTKEFINHVRYNFKKIPFNKLEIESLISIGIPLSIDYIITDGPKVYISDIDCYPTVTEYSFSITKYDDEWYYLEYHIDSLAYYMGDIQCFMCDQFDELLNIVSNLVKK